MCSAYVQRHQPQLLLVFRKSCFSSLRTVLMCSSVTANLCLTLIRKENRRTRQIHLEISNLRISYLPIPQPNIIQQNNAHISYNKTNPTNPHT